MRALVLTILMALLLPGVAHGVALTNADGSPVGDPWQAWADQSLAPSPPGTVTFTVGACPYDARADGCARWYRDGRGEVYVKLEHGARRTELHELGHIFDARVMNDTAREAWKHAIDDERPGWMTSAGDANRCEQVCEWFAEGYSKCALRGPYINSSVLGAYGYEMGPIRHRRACRVLRMAAAGVYGPASAPASAGQPRSIEQRRAPLVLLLPGGGWQHADPETMRPWLTDFAAHGIRARAITYPLKNVIAAIDAVRQDAAAEPGPVIAYGISAGGTIAAALAATGDVAGAVNIAGPTDFTRWMSPAGLQIMRQIGMRTPAQKRAASPYWRLNGLQSPQLVQCGIADPLVEYTQCARYASAAYNSQRDTRLQPMVNAHAQSSRDRMIAREWIAAHWPAS